MKKGGGRNKGNGFEREIAAMLVETFSSFGVKKKHCYRTPGSGGHRQARNTDPGDLVIHSKLRKLFPYCVECKSYKDINLFDLYTPFKKHKKSSKFKQWLKQACTAAKRTHQLPLLVFKKNRSEILCAYRVDKGAFFPSPVYLKFRYAHEDWYVTTFDKLLKQLVIIQSPKYGNIG